MQHFFIKIAIRIALKTKRLKKIFNLDTAKQIGMIVSVDELDSVENLQSFIRELSKNNKQVHLLAWSTTSKAPEKMNRIKDLQLLSKKDCSFFGKPKTKEYLSFIEKQYDILISLSSEEDPMLTYLSIMTKASMKVSQASEKNLLWSDILIKKEKGTEQSTYYQQVIHYLSLINTSKNEAS